MNLVERDRLIAMYRDGHRVVVAALDGIDEAELDAREGPGEWSPREVVHHLADSEMTSALRLRRLLAEDGPLITGYDQDEYAVRLHYGRPIAASLAAFGAARASTAELFPHMSGADWSRTGTHSDSGPYGVEDWLAIYGVHAHDHADQIRRARSKVG